MRWRLREGLRLGTPISNYFSFKLFSLPGQNSDPALRCSKSRFGHAITIRFSQRMLRKGVQTSLSAEPSQAPELTQLTRTVLLRGRAFSPAPPRGSSCNNHHKHNNNNSCHISESFLWLIPSLAAVVEIPIIFFRIQADEFSVTIDHQRVNAFRVRGVFGVPVRHFPDDDSS